METYLSLDSFGRIIQIKILLLFTLLPVRIQSREITSCEVSADAFKELTIIVDNGADKLVLLEHGEELQSFGLTQDVAALQAVDPCHQVVHLDACPVVRQLPPSWK